VGVSAELSGAFDQELDETRGLGAEAATGGLDTAVARLRSVWRRCHSPRFGLSHLAAARTGFLAIDNRRPRSALSPIESAGDIERGRHAVRDGQSGHCGHQPSATVRIRVHDEVALVHQPRDKRCVRIQQVDAVARLEDL
jgi:hypothetical protein